MGQYNLDYTHHKSLRRIGQDQPARDDVIIKRTSALTKQAPDVVRLSPPLVETECAISVLAQMRVVGLLCMFTHRGLRAVWYV